MWHYTTIMLPSERLLFCGLVTSIPRATGLGPPYSARKKSGEPFSCTLQPGHSGKQRKGILAALHRGKVCMIIITGKGMPTQEWLSPVENQEASKELTNFRSFVAAQCPVAGAAW